MTATTKKSYVDQMQELIDKQRKIARKEGREGGVQFCLGFSNLTDEQIARNFCQIEHARMEGRLKLVSLDDFQL